MNNEHRRHISFEVHTLDNMINRRLMAYGAEVGIDNLTFMNGWILGYLYDHPDRDIYQRDIECDFRIARSTVTGIVQLMEKKGYIERQSVPCDARLKKLVLTPLGREIHLHTIRDFETVEAELLRGITPEELETFYAIVKKLKKNVE